MEQFVEFRTLNTSNGKLIGVARLTHLKALNALNAAMIDMLYPQLLEWQQDPQVVCVILEGEGEKAFCAGGDVVAMYHAIQSSPGKIPPQVEHFFAQEYRLDFLIHQYNKPVLVWANGIVMGGGLGLMAGASHRIVTESSMIAMPEVTIGLYPDVGGSWFLNRMPGGSGLFLGITGARLDAADALYLNLAEHFIPHHEKLAFMEQLVLLNWGETQSLNHQKLTDLCQRFQQLHSTALPKGNVKRLQRWIDHVTDAESISEVVTNILSEASDDQWIQRAQATLQKGSPITVALVAEQLKRGATCTLADCFRMELVMSCRCAEVGDFAEGVRALLVDKDHQPKWQYATIDSVPEALVQHHFVSPWAEDEHPLAELGSDESNNTTGL